MPKENFIVRSFYAIALHINRSNIMFVSTILALVYFSYNKQIFWWMDNKRET